MMNDLNIQYAFFTCEKGANFFYAHETVFELFY